MATSCVEYFDWGTFKHILDPVITREEMRQDIQQIAVEKIAHIIAIKEFGYQEDGYTQPKQHGFDDVLRQGNKIIIVEVQTSKESGPPKLGKAIDGNLKMSVQSVAKTAKKMAHKGTTMCEGNNIALGQEILEKLEKGLVSRQLVNFNPETGVTTVYEAQGTTNNWVETNRYTNNELTEKLGKDAKEASKSAQPDIEPHLASHIESGIHGEMVAEAIAIKRFGFSHTGYEPPNKGIDRIFKDGNSLVIMEAKSVAGHVPSSLHPTNDGKRQMDKNWIRKHAESLAKSGLGANKALGEEILTRIDDKNNRIASLRRILVNTHPVTGEITCYEADWKTNIWVEIDPFDD